MIRRIFVVLPANRTYDRRLACFEILSPGIAVLQVTEIDSRRKADKSRVRRYAVKEEDRADGGRVFRLTKPGGEEFYHVLLSDNQAQLDRCGCRAFESGKNCVHTQAVRLAHQRGAFSSPDWA